MIINSFYQGGLPSCQTLSAIGALLLNDRGRLQLEKMVCHHGGKLWDVTFPLRPHDVFRIEVQSLSDEEMAQMRAARERRLQASTAALPAGHWIMPQLRAGNVTGDTIVQVLEAGYAAYMRATEPELFADIEQSHILSVYTSKSFHYRSAQSLRDLSGWTVEELIAGGGPVPEESESFKVEARKNPELIETVMKKLRLISANPQAFAVTVCTVGQPNSRAYLDEGNKILPWHDHILRAVREDSQSIEIIDPYNSRIGLVLHYEDFFKYFNLMAIAQARP